MLGILRHCEVVGRGWDTQRRNNVFAYFEASIVFIFSVLWQKGAQTGYRPPLWQTGRPRATEIQCHGAWGTTIVPSALVARLQRRKLTTEAELTLRKWELTAPKATVWRPYTALTVSCGGLKRREEFKHFT